MALMGDPTLRLHSVLPPANLVCKPRGSALALSWKRSPDAAIAGYLVSRAATPAGPFQRVFGGTVPTASFIDRTIAPGATCVYMVRAVKRESSPSGTYLNPSQGIFTVAVTAAAVTGNGNAVADGDTRAMSANGTDFGSASVGQSVAHTFTVKNVGLAPLALSSARLTGANAADFSIGTPPPATLGPGASASLQISFHPSVASARSAKFSMRCNDPNQTLFDFTLAGVGN
jgi:hypothetical protein